MAAPYRARDLGADIHRQVRKILRDGGPLGDYLRIPAADRQTLYAVAHKLYAQARYDLAQHLFAQLVMYDHHEPRYMKGLAAATQMLGNHEEAMRMYSVVALMDASDPTVVMHAGDCFRAMGRYARAAESFDLAQAMCSKAEHEPVKRRCNQLLAQLRRAA